MTGRSVFVTGATGLVGRQLCLELARAGFEVRALTRRGLEPAPHPSIIWINGDLLKDGYWPSALDGVEAVVHLAGESVAEGRWSPERKRALVESRVVATRRLVAEIGKLDQRPSVLVCASACGYYGPRGEEVLDESSAPGTDFLATLCVDWESAAREAEELGLRVVSLRFGMVLSARGGALPRMLPIFRLGLGGPLGPSRRYTPWVHIDDATALARRALEGGGGALSGPVNVVSPGTVRMGEFARALGRALDRPAFLPVPLPVLRVVLGEATDAVVPGQRVVPRAAREAGFPFRHSRIESALRSLLD
jgi:hypothetical protein